MNHKRVDFVDIQPHPFVEAYVKLSAIYDRDNLADTSPHHVGYLTFTVKRHNQGSNWIALLFNRECWIMLLGFPLDYMARQLI